MKRRRLFSVAKQHALSIFIIKYSTSIHAKKVECDEMMTDSKIYPSIFQTAYPMEGHVDAKSVLGREQGNTMYMCVDQAQ